MKVMLTSPWDNAWVPMFRAEVERRGHTFSLNGEGLDRANPPDLVIHGWAKGEPLKGARNIVFLRRFELFDGALKKVRWQDYDAVILCNEWIAEHVREYFKMHGITTPGHLIYNAVDVSQWTLVKGAPEGIKLGMACHVHPKKNIPLALQILAELPMEAELHIAGEVQCAMTAEYLNHLAIGMRRRVYLYGHIPREQLNVWWQDKRICLSTSLSEGNPNAILEAMAKGIPPAVHDWPGADTQFLNHHRFRTIEEAIEIILADCPSARLAAARNFVETNYSLRNIERAVDVALGEHQEKTDEKLPQAADEPQVRRLHG